MSTEERRSRQQYSPEFKLKLGKMALAVSENGSSVATLAVNERWSHIVNSLPLSHSGLSQYN